MKALLFLGAGLLMLLSAAVLAFGTVSFLRHADRAEGEVVALNAGGSHPQVRFALPDGRAVSYPQGGWIAGYRVGDRVTVRYRPEQPAATARIDAVGSLWLWPIALGFMGALFALAGLLNRTGGR